MCIRDRRRSARRSHACRHPAPGKHDCSAPGASEGITRRVISSTAHQVEGLDTSHLLRAWRPLSRPFFLTFCRSNQSTLDCSRMIVNDNALNLMVSGGQKFFASELAPTGARCQTRRVFQKFRFTECTTTVQTDGTVIGIVPPLFA